MQRVMHLLDKIELEQVVRGAIADVVPPATGLRLFAVFMSGGDYEVVERLVQTRMVAIEMAAKLSIGSQFLMLQSMMRTGLPLRQDWRGAIAVDRSGVVWSIEDMANGIPDHPEPRMRRSILHRV